MPLILIVVYKRNNSYILGYVLVEIPYWNNVVRHCLGLQHIQHYWKLQKTWIGYPRSSFHHQIDPCQHPGD